MVPVFNASAINAGFPDRRAACKAFVADPPALDITIQADRTTAAPGDSIQFDIRAQGGALLGIEIAWGDGGSLEVPALGAHSARTVQRHAFAQPGVYDVTATVMDGAAGNKAAGLRIRIQ